MCDLGHFKCLGLVLWSSIWSVLENVPYVLEKILFSDVIEWNALLMYVRYSWCILLFKSLYLLRCEQGSCKAIVKNLNLLL